MRIVIDTPENIARYAAEQYVSLYHHKPNAVMGLATGSTPLPLYGELIRAYRQGRVTFRHGASFNLDEYVGLAPEHDQSYHYFMRQHLFDHIDLPRERIHVPNGLDSSQEALMAYEQEIEAFGGIDIQLLGIGCDGHIGFSEPGTPFGSRTHVAELTQNTMEVNARFFQSIDQVPRSAVTMGIRTVMNAREIILIATGKSKAEIIKATLTGPVTEAVPASVLQLHPCVTLYLDEEAAALL